MLAELARALHARRRIGVAAGKACAPFAEPAVETGEGRPPRLRVTSAALPSLLISAPGADTLPPRT